MTPYASFTYFGILLYPIIPLIILGVVGSYALHPSARLARSWAALSMFLMLLIQYWGTITLWPGAVLQELWIVAAYAIYQVAVTRTFITMHSATKSRAPLFMAVALSLLPLALSKFTPLLAPGSAIGFLGISYVTFRALDVVFSIQDNVVNDVPTSQLLAFLLFFPTISSGPIDRYRRFSADWKRLRSRAQVIQDLDGAVQHIFTGLLLKFILAALLKQYVLDPVSTSEGPFATLGTMYAYSLYLFFDFAGYSALAIGVSYIFGIHTPENFRDPFRSPNIREFWNRWHISLSWWFRDHVYMRFVLAATRGRWFKGRNTASYAGFVLSFGLMGLWHGTAPHFLLYGLYHAALLIGYDVFTRLNREYVMWGESPPWQVANVVLTFHAVCFGFLLFSGRII
ncbi:MAG: D-alanyl-lipoteichoic acid biosynthesis protein DltB [Chloroflexota bacterium]